MDHQINADTLRKYLPQEENQQGLVLRAPQEPAGKDYSHEIGILYNMVMQNKKDLEELKALLHNAVSLKISRHRDHRIPTFEQTRSIPIATPKRSYPSKKIASAWTTARKELIRRALELTGGNRKEAAAQLGLSERTLYRKIKEYGL